MIGFHGHGRLLRATDYVVRGEAWPFVNLVHELGFPVAALFAVASALAESAGALLVGIGLWTRFAGAALAGNLLVALVNEWLGGDPIELPAIYFVVSLAVVLAGAGGYSVDAVLARSRDARDRGSAETLPAPVAVPGSDAR